MDRTSDFLRPSDVVNKDEMSYLFGRDPSIMSYEQRPQVCQEAKKNLLSLYEVEKYNLSEESTSSYSLPDYLQTVKVYLRMKPFPKKIKLEKENEEAYFITNSTTLLTRLPVMDNNTSYLNKTKGSDIVCRKFTFTKTFGPETTQLEFFDDAIKPKMIKFLEGQNCTVMTYGTTNSGKSYTLQGTISSPGIIPRALEFVFSNITPKTTPSYKPVHNHDVIILDASQRAQELEEKTKLLTFGSINKIQYISAYRQMQQLLQEESPLRPSQCSDAHYSVWVSFAEIYNETIYDLLSNECQKKKQPLKLATGSEGKAFIKGLKMICVNSGSEAYQVLMAGQYNLKVAATALNARSSRSHCIFTIKLLKYHMENLPETVEVSTFAFCDLAGSERLKKTLNIGDRLKEAQNINTSLLVLGKCLKYIYDGQNFKQKNDHIGPFRESKLTRLFQQALSGKEHMALIVNVNPIPNLYVETQNVLIFSAIAKKIVIEPKKVTKKKSKTRFSLTVAQSLRTVTDWDSTNLESIDEENTNSEETQDHDDDIYDTLMNENENLKKELNALKNSMLERDIQIRREMADKYSIIIKQIEEDWKNRVKDVEARQEDTLESTVKQVEDFYEQKLSEFTNYKRKRRDDDYDECENDNENILEELKSEKSKVESLKDIIKKLKKETKILLAEKNQISFECSLMKEELKNTKGLLIATKENVCTDEGKVYIEELESQLSVERDRIRKLKEFLNEAKEDYIQITTDAREKEERIKELEDIIIKYEDKIEELETDLENANVCLTEKTSTIEVLEEKLESESKKLLDVKNKMQDMEKKSCELENELKEQTSKLLDAENKVQCMQIRITELKDTNRDLLHRIQNLPENKQLKTEDTSTVEEYEEIVMKQEILSDSVGEQPESRTEIEKQIKTMEAENYSLQTILAQRTTKIQFLRENLEDTKCKLKDISEQLNNLKSNAVISANSEKENQVYCADIGCQVEILTNSKTTMNKNEQSQANQTGLIENAVEKQSVQISILVDEKLNDAKKQLVGTKAKCQNLEAQHELNCSKIETLSQELDTFKEKVKTLTNLIDTNKSEINEYKSSIDVLQADLNAVKKEKNDFEEKFIKTERAKNELQQQLSQRICDYESKITNLQNEISVANERIEIKTRCIEDHEERISSLKEKINSAQELHDKIIELTKNMETCQNEKNELQRLINENNVKLSDCEEQITKAHQREQDKDEEILNLQKEIKYMIRNNEDQEKSSKMEMEMKKTLKELADLRETLSRKDELLRNLEIRQVAFEQNAKIIDHLQQSAQERQTDNDKLRNINEELKNSLLAKDCEMESFRKNRDETINKYEALVRSQQEELERQKREVMRFQELFRRQTTPTPSKDEIKKLKVQIKELEDKLKHYETCPKGKDCVQISDEEVSVSERRVRGRRRKENFVSPNKVTDDVSVVELCDSESKRSTRRTALAPPSIEPTSERKRTTRKKKLFVQANESLEDIEPLENVQSSGVLPSPTCAPRSLRSRKK